MLWSASHARGLAGNYSGNVLGGRGHWHAITTAVLGTSHSDRLPGGADERRCAFGDLGRLGEHQEVWMSPRDGRESSNLGRPRLVGIV